MASTDDNAAFPFGAYDEGGVAPSPAGNTAGRTAQPSSTPAPRSAAATDERLAPPSRPILLGLWAIPVVALTLALAGGWGWPGSTPGGPFVGTWLKVSVAALAFGLAGAIALAALLRGTRGRVWAVAGLLAVATSTVAFGPMLGLAGMARAGTTNVADRLSGFDPLGGWPLAVALTLQALGWLALGCAVIASRVLNRSDGLLMIFAVALAAVAAYLSWQFVVVIAAMALLAAGLGLVWAAIRLPVEPAPR